MKALHGLYVVTPEVCADLILCVRQAIAGGASMVQYRDKQASAATRASRAHILLQLCRENHVPLIINDDVELALTLGADGVHVGTTDPEIGTIRQQMPQAVIGASCYNDWTSAEQAAQAGASYLAFGSFYPSLTKPDAAPADRPLLMRARQELSLPICAIGGIDASNAAGLIEAGADLLAVSHHVFAAPDITAACASIAALFPSDD